MKQLTDLSLPKKPKKKKKDMASLIIEVGDTALTKLIKEASLQTKPTEVI